MVVKISAVLKMTISFQTRLFLKVVIVLKVTSQQLLLLISNGFFTIDSRVFFRVTILHFLSSAAASKKGENCHRILRVGNCKQIKTRLV